ncbi:MAG: DNA recombination protein RmuC [Fibrobacteria bacterium]|nr:DNA recombination protein RmuC [Fibrobacteria bacterium]
MTPSSLLLLLLPSVCLAGLLLALALLAMRRASTVSRALEAARQEVRDLEIEAARLRVERDADRDALERHRQEEVRRSELIRSEIEGLSHRIFEEKTGIFRSQGTQAIAELLQPVRERLETLQKSMIEAERTDAVRERGLHDALQRMVSLNERLGSQAENLARALKGDNRASGEYGEVLLGRILEAAGLVRGIHFVEQGEGLELKDEAARHLKPDVVVLLPENRCLVVDSKMSLSSWMDAQTEDESLREAALAEFRRSLRAHVDNLASKPYTEALVARGHSTVDFRFLFVPIEAAFQVVLARDPSLYADAFGRKVVLVSPTTLLAVLTTIQHTWKQFDLGRNAQEIGHRAGLLLGKLHDFLGSMEELGRHLDRARDSFEEARRRLVAGRGNLIRQSGQLQDLGARTEKRIPPTMAPSNSSLDPDLDDPEGDFPAEDRSRA